MCVVCVHCLSLYYGCIDKSLSERMFQILDQVACLAECLCHFIRELCVAVILGNVCLRQDSGVTNGGVHG